METKEIKLDTPLTIDQIDFRVQSINKGGYATLLCYKDARCDMNRLDDVFTPMGWQKKFDIIGGELFCSVGVWSRELSQWIWKSDVGTESKTEAEKGRASDSFKRACFNWGIGRELYEYPVIQVKLDASEFTVDGGSVRPTYNFKLKEWRWFSQFDKDNKLNYIAAKDQNGKLRFQWGKYREEGKV